MSSDYEVGIARPHVKQTRLVSTHAVAGSIYVGFVLAVLAVAATEWRARRDVRSGGRVRVRALRAARGWLILGVVAAGLLSVLSQRNLWPFSNWALMTGEPRRDMGVNPTYLRLAVVDESGAEHRVDHRAVEPFAFEELMAWMRKVFVELPPAAQDSAARFLLDRINVARARVRAGESPSSQERWLGSLRAPYHLLHPKRWTAPESVPTAPFLLLRVYGETWDLDARARDPSAFVARLVYESPAGAP